MGFLSEGPRKKDALLLASGEFAYLAIVEFLDSERMQGVVYRLIVSVHGDAYQTNDLNQPLIFDIFARFCLFYSSDNPEHLPTCDGSPNNSFS